MIQLQLKVAASQSMETPETHLRPLAFAGSFFVPPLFLTHSCKDSNADEDYVLPIFPLPSFSFLSDHLYEVQHSCFITNEPSVPTSEYITQLTPTFPPKPQQQRMLRVLRMHSNIL